MIIKVEKEEQIKKLLELCNRSALGCKIAAIALAYDFTEKFASFWYNPQSLEIFCMVDNVMIIAGTIINRDETLMFLRAVGTSVILCTVRNTDVLPIQMEKQGDILKKHSNMVTANDGYVSSQVNIRDIYSLLEETKMITEEEFESFYLDLSHRIRHDHALAMTTYKGKEIVACLLSTSITIESAIMSVVAVKEPYRGHGLASSLMKKAEEVLSNRVLYVFCEKGKNRKFYTSLGYKKTDAWVQGTLKL